MDAPDRGFALLVVAITLAVLSLIFAAALGTARQHLSYASAAGDRVRLGAAIDGAVATVEYDLATAGNTPPAILKAPQILRIGDVVVRIAARPETAKLDLNEAPLPALNRLFVNAGISAHDAKDLADAIGKRRKDRDARKQSRDDLLFQAVSEIGGLKGVDRDLVDCVMPDLTVFSGAPLVDAEYASPHVRTALGLGAKPDTQPRISSLSGNVVTAGEPLELTATATDSLSHSVLSRMVVIRLTGNSDRPVWTLAETSPAPTEEASQAACTREAVRRGAKSSAG